MNKANATSALLAAEVDYLTAWGWIPYVVQNPGSQSRIRWSKVGEESRINQELAVGIQKMLDPHLANVR